MKTTTITISVPVISPARIASATRNIMRNAARHSIHFAIGAATASFSAVLLDMHAAAGVTAIAAAIAVATSRR